MEVYPIINNLRVRGASGPFIWSMVPTSAKQNTESRRTERPLVFISYSKMDASWKDDHLLPQLKTLEMADRLTVWNDDDIDVGGKWYPEIEKAMERAAVALCLISAHYLSTPFCVKEEIPYLLNRQENEGLELIFILLSPCSWELFPWLSERQMLPRKGKSIAEDYAGREAGVFHTVAERIIDILDEPSLRLPEELPDSVTSVMNDPDIQLQVPVPSAWLGQKKIDIERLPVTGAELFGRQAELTLLDEAWASESTNVVSLVAWGGVGKSTLVNKWLEQLKADNYRGAKRVFGWSFYSQGTGERVTSADEFIAEALTWFGDPDPTAGSPWSKGERLADLVSRQETLLVLDGLEPLQDPHRGIKDPGLQRLVEEVARDNKGLCLVTTREPIGELDHFEDTAIQKNLEQISPQAGRALLRVKGVRGSDVELEQASCDFGNHALAINLLASYLRDVPGHHVSHNAEIADLPEIRVEDGRHPRRVMEAFAKRFGSGPEIEVLFILGLFDRPASDDCLTALRRPPAIPMLTEHLVNLPDAEWMKLLGHIRGFGLIATERLHVWGQLDSHPLVREHFAAWLQREYPTSWHDGHSRLCNHLGTMPSDHQKLETLLPLFQAVYHGCAARNYNSTFKDIYAEKIQSIIWSSASSIDMAVLGSELAALAHFFEHPWHTPRPELNEIYRRRILNQTGFRLMALGRFREAKQPLMAELEAELRIKDWRWLAVTAINLSDTALLLGEITNARSFAEQGVDYADRGGSPHSRVASMVRLAMSIGAAGDMENAQCIFKKIRDTEFEYGNHLPRLELLCNLRHCDLLIEMGKIDEASKIRSDLEENNTSIYRSIDKGVVNLSSGKLAFHCNYFEISHYHLRIALDFLRDAGMINYLIDALLVEAALHIAVGRSAHARRDLDESMRLARRSEMRLHECDAHLGYARLCLAEANTDQARDHVVIAKRIVNDTAYHLRDKDIMQLQAELD